MIEQLIANFHGGGRLVFWMLIPAALSAVGLSFWRMRRTRNPEAPKTAITGAILDAAIAWTLFAMAIVGFYGYSTTRFARVQWVPFEEFFRLDDGNDRYAGLGLLLGNVLLFMPIGFLMLLRVPRWGVRRITLGAAIASLAIESTQFLVPGGRVASVDDVILNTLGAAIGALAAVGVRSLARSRRGRAASA